MYKIFLKVSSSVIWSRFTQVYSEDFENVLDCPKRCKGFGSAYADVVQRIHRVADFMQSLAQKDTVQGRWMHGLRGY